MPSATSPNTCQGCSAGKFSTLLGASSPSVCQLCLAGTYQDDSGQSACKECPINTFGDFAGSKSISNCFLCRPTDTSTRGLTGRQFETACICNPNYYRINGSTVQCQECPPGLGCDGTGRVEPIVNHSRWEIISRGSNDYYRLVFCPQGYYYADLLLDHADRPDVASHMAVQQCSVCGRGAECTSPPCA